MKMAGRCLTIIFGAMMAWSCSKEEPCQTCSLAGVYSGVFHDIAACYGCVPFRDTVFTGSFVVTSTDHDSLKIVRSHDKYEWKFAFSSDKKYRINSNGSLWEEFTFKSADSLSYFYNLGGSGGYFRSTFEGKR